LESPVSLQELSLEEDGGKRMKAIITHPGRIRKPQLNGCCCEKMCTKEPTHNMLIIDIEGLPLDLYIVLCEEHAEAFRGNREIELTRKEK